MLIPYFSKPNVCLAASVYTPGPWWDTDANAAAIAPLEGQERTAPLTRIFNVDPVRPFPYTRSAALA